MTAVIRWEDEPPAIVLLDQTRLPHEETEFVCRDVPTLIDAIQRLVVRGAPLLGIAGAYGVALADARADDVGAAARAIAEARPTAVNLAWGVKRALGADDALIEAHAIAEEERLNSVNMAAHGMTLLGGRERVRLLTHCNTGALAAGGDGTAFAVIKKAHRENRLEHLWIDETRPLLQGARLTAYEAELARMPYSVLSDNAAGSLFAASKVDAVLVGADRIAEDGSVANKVGTYPLAVLAHHHKVPFFVVAPLSTVDLDTPTGEDIVVEKRPGAEVTKFGNAYNPAFDVTPPSLITAIVSERGIAHPVSAGSLRRLYTQVPKDKEGP